MTKYEAFKIIKEANSICDKMEKLDKNSKEYDNYEDAVYWLIDTLVGKYPVRYSKRTGHYYIPNNN